MHMSCREITFLSDVMIAAVIWNDFIYVILYAVIVWPCSSK